MNDGYTAGCAAHEPSHLQSLQRKFEALADEEMRIRGFKPVEHPLVMGVHIYRRLYQRHGVEVLVTASLQHLLSNESDKQMAELAAVRVGRAIGMLEFADG